MDMDQVLEQIGKRLYQRRKQVGMTQDALAEWANITSQTISTAELGKKAMRTDTIIRVCESLDITPNYLLLGEVTSQDVAFLTEKISQLSPEQYRHLEDIINSYIAALNLSET